jgi:hypothetical protein
MQVLAPGDDMSMVITGYHPGFSLCLPTNDDNHFPENIK